MINFIHHNGVKTKKTQKANATLKLYIRCQVAHSYRVGTPYASVYVCLSVRLSWLSHSCISKIKQNRPIGKHYTLNVSVIVPQTTRQQLCSVEQLPALYGVAITTLLPLFYTSIRY